jgi:cysteine desulfuration protein SufE
MAVLMEVYNDNPPAENLSIDPAFLSEAGITDHLSMNRRNGLANLFKQIHLYSATFKALSNQLDKK